MNPYVIGEEARKRKAAASNLNYHGNYMQAQAAKDTSGEKKAEANADDVWKKAAEDGELNSKDDTEANEFMDEENAEDDFSDTDAGLTNFMDKKAYKEMVSNMEEMPYGAEDWIYSNWNYYGSKPEKLSPYWWFTFILKFVKVVHTGYSMFGKIESKYYFFDVGRKGSQFFLKFIYLLNDATSWKLFDGAKPWARRADPEPKPENYKELKYRPTSWSGMKKVKKDKKLPF